MKITKLLPILLLFGLPIVVNAQFIYTTNNGAITITHYSGSDTTVTIPSTTNGWPINSIGPSAFADCYSLTSVTIGTNIVSIGKSAFAETSLTNVTIPNSVTNIGQEAFRDCGNLTAIIVVTNNPTYASVANVLFDKNQTTLVEYPAGMTGNYNVPNNVISIANRAFYFCTKVTGVTIPNSVTNIGTETFNGSGLTNVIIPDSVTSIGEGAFQQSLNLNAITVDSNNPAYSSVAGVLFDKNETTLIAYPPGRGGSYTAPNGVTNIAEYAFQACFGLTSVIFPQSVTTIGTWIFSQSSSLRSVYFEGNEPTNVSAYPFIGSNPTVYYLPGTSGWSSRFGDPLGLPTAPWWLPIPTILNFEPSFGVQTNEFGFMISWATNISIVIEACTNLANPVWLPVATNTLTSGSSYFSDSQWPNYPGRFYRLRSP